MNLLQKVMIYTWYPLPSSSIKKAEHVENESSNTCLSVLISTLDKTLHGGSDNEINKEVCKDDTQIKKGKI